MEEFLLYGEMCKLGCLRFLGKNRKGNPEQKGVIKQSGRKN